VPSRTDLYTFYTPVAANYHTGGSAAGLEVSERVKLWIDDVMLVDQWDSLSALEPSATYAFAYGMCG